MTTIEKKRSQIKPDEIPDRSHKSKVTSTRRPISYACIPRVICADPRSHRLSPFEIAIMGTLRSLARLQHKENDHQKALAAGRANGIEQELNNFRWFKDDWKEINARRRSGVDKGIARAPTIRHVTPVLSNELTYVERDQPERHKPIKKSKALKQAGSHAYRKEMKRLRKLPMTKDVVVDISRTQLLLAARMSDSKGNLLRLDQALDALAKEIRIDGETMPPFCMIESFESRLLLSVSWQWLNTQYKKVPLPLPIKSHLATKLLLWLRHINIWHEKRDSDFAKLAEKFGYASLWRANQAFNRALTYLNDWYLPKLDLKALHKDHKIQMPALYEIKADGTRIQFVGHDQGTYPYDRARQRHPSKRKHPSKPRKRVVAREHLDERDYIESLREGALGPNVVSGLGVFR